MKSEFYTNLNVNNLQNNDKIRTYSSCYDALTIIEYRTNPGLIFIKALFIYVTTVSTHIIRLNALNGAFIINITNQKITSVYYGLSRFITIWRGQ